MSYARSLRFTRELQRRGNLKMSVEIMFVKLKRDCIIAG